MKLVELLDKAVETGKVIHVPDWVLGMKYVPHMNCFIYCHKDGNFVEPEGLNKKVALCPKIMNEDRWEFYKEPYKVGDRFIIPGLMDEHKSGEVLTTCKGENLIGELSEVCDEKTCKIYKLSFDYGFTPRWYLGEELDRFERVY